MYASAFKIFQSQLLDAKSSDFRSVFGTHARAWPGLAELGWVD